MNNVYLSDWLENDIPDKSINLIFADPPYFEVKGDFDFIWKSFDDYLQDVEKWAIECKRVLADNGSLLWWGHAKKIAYSQIIFDKYFNLENSLVWENTNPYKQQTRFSPDLNSFASLTERLLFYSNEVEMTGLETITEEFIKPNNPFSKYLREEFSRAGISAREIAKLFLSKTGGLTGCVSNWLNGDNIITKDQYSKIRDYTGNDYFTRNYEELTQEYENLRQEYEYLRRAFDNQYNFGDVLHYANRDMQDYDHDTIKPLTLTKKLIQTTTRKGDLVLIPFGGSGTEVEACINTGRKYICYEIEKKHYNTIKNREKNTLLQKELFNEYKNKR